MEDSRLRWADNDVIRLMRLFQVCYRTCKYGIHVGSERDARPHRPFSRHASHTSPTTLTHPTRRCHFSHHSHNRVRAKSRFRLRPCLSPGPVCEELDSDEDTG